jgi:hypothetical protein
MEYAFDRVKTHLKKRETMSWNDFTDAGFSRSDDPLSESLSFSPPVQSDIKAWPQRSSSSLTTHSTCRGAPLADFNLAPRRRSFLDREVVRQRLAKLQKNLPSFEYDIRPRLGGEVLVEEAFLDAWCDLLISGGWMDRDETTLRECNWAIVRPLSLIFWLRPVQRVLDVMLTFASCSFQVQYKALPIDGNRISTSDADPRTDSLYFVFEEVVRSALA